MSEQWVQSKLSYLAHISSGESSVIESSGPHPIMGANGEIGRAKSYNFENGYLVGRVGAAGAVSKFLGKCWASDNTLTVEPRSDRVEFSFLGCLLKHLKLERLATKTAQPLITQTHLKSLLVEYPASFSEQKTIANILDTLDIQIRHTEAIIAKLQQVKQGLLHDLLTRGIDERGQLRPPCEQAPALYKKSPLGWIPKEWDSDVVQNVMQICNTVRKPISAGVRDGMQGIYPYYGPTGILDYINEYKAEGVYVLIGEDGDHFLKFSTQSMTQVVEGKFNVNNHAHVLKGTNRCISEWFGIYFRHKDITLHLTRQGAGRFKLNKASLSCLPMSFPKEKEEQRMILKRVDTMENRIKKDKSFVLKLKKQKAGLMDNLLTGRVRVTELIDEPQAS